jgi:hypothetical protein
MLDAECDHITTATSKGLALLVVRHALETG